MSPVPTLLSSLAQVEEVRRSSSRALSTSYGNSGDGKETYVLCLHSTPLDGTKTAQLVACLPSLRVLVEVDLACCDVDDPSCIALCDGLYHHAKQVRSLRLGGNRIGDPGAKAIARFLSKNKFLETLNLRFNVIRDAGMAAIARSMEEHPTLQSLNVASNLIGDQAAVHIAAALPKCRSLRRIELFGNEIGGRGATALSDSLPSCSSLDVLDLWCNHIGSRGAAQIGVAMRRPGFSVKELRVGKNEIGDDGAVALAQGLAASHSLLVLEASGNEISDKGAIAIADALESGDGLVRLNLRDNKVTYVGCLRLANAARTQTKLSYMNLVGNSLTTEESDIVTSRLRESANQRLVQFVSGGKKVETPKRVERVTRPLIVPQDIMSTEWDKKDVDDVVIKQSRSSPVQKLKSVPPTRRRPEPAPVSLDNSAFMDDNVDIQEAARALGEASVADADTYEEQLLALARSIDARRDSPALIAEEKILLEEEDTGNLDDDKDVDSRVGDDGAGLQAARSPGSIGFEKSVDGSEVVSGDKRSSPQFKRDDSSRGLRRRRESESNVIGEPEERRSSMTKEDTDMRRMGSEPRFSHDEQYGVDQSFVPETRPIYQDDFVSPSRGRSLSQVREDVLMEEAGGGENSEAIGEEDLIVQALRGDYGNESPPDYGSNEDSKMIVRGSRTEEPIGGANPENDNLFVDLSGIDSSDRDGLLLAPPDAAATQKEESFATYVPPPPPPLPSIFDEAEESGTPKPQQVEKALQRGKSSFDCRMETDAKQEKVIVEIAKDAISILRKGAFGKRKPLRTFIMVPTLEIEFDSVDVMKFDITTKFEKQPNAKMYCKNRELLSQTFIAFKEESGCMHSYADKEKEMPVYAPRTDEEHSQSTPTQSKVVLLVSEEDEKDDHVVEEKIEDKFDNQHDEAEDEEEARTCIATHDYECDDGRMLSVQEGDMLQIHYEEQGWLMCSNANGETGFVSPYYVEEKSV